MGDDTTMQWRNLDFLSTFVGYKKFKFHMQGVIHLTYRIVTIQLWWIDNHTETVQIMQDETMMQWRNWTFKHSLWAIIIPHAGCNTYVPYNMWPYNWCRMNRQPHWNWAVQLTKDKFTMQWCNLGFINPPLWAMKVQIPHAGCNYTRTIQHVSIL